ncbi:MAG: hypothetical protein KGN00_11100 [Chloroflexota bacterium]|nr:hypothetical protein [Chloroflexota bacterium]
MRRRLLPYAIVAALVVVASSAALFATVRPTADSGPSATVAPEASATHAAPELSRTARLAYWRDKRLWVSDLDGSLRYPIASIDDVRRVSLTRWSTDGGSVAYVQASRVLVVVPTQGESVAVPLPRELLAGGYEIKDVRWSTDSRRIAATVLRQVDGTSDVYLVDLGASPPEWVRVTKMEDVFAADWISPNELLGYTAGGAVVVMTATQNGTVRLLTGAVGVSPIVGPDGRIYFLAGRVPFSRDPSFPFQTAMRASVWSVTADGSDARQETRWELNDLRLDARLPDGRYLIYRGASDALGTVTDQVTLLPSYAGVVERLRVAPDGRTAYGFTPDKIVRVDLTKVANAADPGAMTVFLDTSGDADVWFPPRATIARGTPSLPATPSIRSAFMLGGHVWQMTKGVATLLVAGPALRRTLAPAPKWSPGGDHLLVVEPTAQGYGTMAASVVDRSGNATALAQTVGTGRSFAWSPSGGEVAIAVDRGGQGATFSTSSANTEIRFFDPTGRATRAAIPGSEVAWTAAGLYLLADVAGAPGQAIERVDGDAAPRTIATGDRLAADARAATTSGGGTTLSGLEASPNGSFASVRLRMSAPSSQRAYLVILGADGTRVQLIRQDDLADVAWSPTSAALGYSTGVRGGDEHAYVVKPDGTTIATTNGRFAGWTPDGSWYLVARAGGLYAHPVAGGAAVLLGPAAAPVSAAPLP